MASIGTGVQAFWDALARGASGATTVEVEGVPPAVAFAVPELDAEERFGRREARRMDRDGQLAGVAATLALEESGDLGLPATRVGVASATLTAAWRRWTPRTARCTSAAPTA